MIQSLPQFILPIQMERSSERLTSLTGLVLVEELARGLGIWERIEELMEGPQSGAGYQPSELVQPLVWMLPGGGRREDLRELREEREVRQELGWKEVPDAGTGGDWLRRHGERGMEAIHSGNREVVQGVLKQQPEEVILDGTPPRSRRRSRKPNGSTRGERIHAVGRVGGRGVRRTAIPCWQGQPRGRDSGVCPGVREGPTAGQADLLPQ